MKEKKQETVIPLAGKEKELRRAIEHAWTIGADNTPQSPVVIGRRIIEADTYWYFKDSNGDFYVETEKGFIFDHEIKISQKKKHRRTGKALDTHDLLYRVTRAILEREKNDMTIFYENKESGLQAGINNDGELFLGDAKSGYNLPDTQKNRAYIRADFERQKKYAKAAY